MFSGVTKFTSRNIFFRNNLLLTHSKSCRYISFKFFDKFKLPQQNAGGVEGTINDKIQPSKISYFDGGFHWSYEKIISVALIPSTLVPFYSFFYLENLAINPILDSALAALILIHASYGYKACIIDYIPKRKYGYWHVICKRILQLGGVLSLYGIFVMETENNGLTNLIKRLWLAKSTKAEDDGK